MQRSCVFFLLFALFPILVSCRNEGATFRRQPRDENDDRPTIESPDEPDFRESPDSGPDLRLFRELPFLEREPEEDEEPTNPDYATNLYLYANCEFDPESLAVSRDVTGDTCSIVNALPWRDDDGDTYEVASPISWTVDDPSIVALDFPLGPDNNLAVPIGLLDAIDMNGEEPWATLRACALNICPDPRPADCEDHVCEQLDIVSVVTVGGDWLLTSFEHDEAPLLLVQIGRDFDDPSHLVERGLVYGINVTFESGDYRYDGEIASDRQSMSGTVTDLIGLAPAGSWFAVRE